MLNQPTSSPMMKRILGFFPSACRLARFAFALAIASSRPFLVAPFEQHVPAVVRERIEPLTGAGDFVRPIVLSAPCRFNFGGDGSAPALGMTSTRLDAARYPSIPPTASTATICALVLTMAFSSSNCNQHVIETTWPDIPLEGGDFKQRKMRCDVAVSVRSEPIPQAQANPAKGTSAQRVLTQHGPAIRRCREIGLAEAQVPFSRNGNSLGRTANASGRRLRPKN